MGTSPPLISIIICTYNRCDSLARTLEGLSRMSIPPDLAWELIIVDNNSSDATRQIVQSFANQVPGLQLKYAFEPAQGLSAARNRGIEESQGAILAFLDDDVLVSAQWLSAVRNAFQKYAPMCMGGRVLLHESISVPSWWDKTHDTPVGKLDRGTSVIVDDKSGMIGIGANIVFKREAFDKYGLFRTEMGRKGTQLTAGEEIDMVTRLRKNNELVIYYPDALVYHCPSAQRFSRRYLRRYYYGLGEWHFLLDQEKLGPVPRIFGVPRWIYRSVLSNVWKTVFLCLRGRRKESFRQQLQVALFLGYFGAAQKMRRAARSETA